jgi:hypothetical protein
MKATARSELAIPLVCGVQLAPAFMVFRMAPPVPTTQPVVSVTKNTGHNELIAPLACIDQFVPPLEAKRTSAVSKKNWDKNFASKAAGWPR